MGIQLLLKELNMNKENREQKRERPKEYQDNIHQDRGTFIRRTFMAVGIGALVVILLLLCWRAIDILLLIFAGTMMAIFLRGLSNLLVRHAHLPNSLSLSIVIMSIMGMFGIVIWLIIPIVSDQIDKLMQTIPQTIQQIKDQLMQYTWAQKLLSKAPNINNVLSGKMNILSKMGNFFSATFGFFANLLIILIIGLFFSINPKSYIKGIVKLAPQGKREHVEEILKEIDTTLFWWLVGKIISMSIIGIFTGIGLKLLGIPLAFALGFIAGLLSFIPNIGPIASAVPAVLLALTKGPMMALYVVFLFLGVQALESYLITPYVQKKTISMPIALVIIAQVLMGVLVGGLGLVFATPLTAAAIVLVKKLYIEDALGDRTA